MSVTGLIASPLIKQAFELVLPVVHDVLGGGKVADKVIKSIKLKALDIDGEKVIAASKIIQAEISSDSFLTRNWRPIVMLIFAGLLVYQVIVVSVVNAIFGAGTIEVDREIIMRVLDIIYFGLGGYVLARSGEKAINRYAEYKTRVVETVASDGMKPKSVPPGAIVEEAPFMRRDT